MPEAAAAAAAPAEAVEESDAEADEEDGWPVGNCGGGGADGSGLCCCCGCCCWREGSGDSLLKLRRPLRLLGMGGSPCRAAAIRLIAGESLSPLH